MSSHPRQVGCSRRTLLRHTLRGAWAAVLGARLPARHGLAASEPPSAAGPRPARAREGGQLAGPKAKTILGIGAHYDDCVFGIPGTLLKAVKKNYRVVVLTLIGDYSNWKPAQGRGGEFLEATMQIGREYGVEMRFLSFAGLKLEANESTKRAVAEAVADIAPEVAFLLWPRDRHPDHEVASALSSIALGQAARLAEGREQYRPPRRRFYYDNGPGHTIGFVPDTFVDVSEEWPQAIQWLGKLMAMVRREPFDAEKRDGAQRAKETLALYRGQACGVQYAEAFRAANAFPSELF